MVGLRSTMGMSEIPDYDVESWLSAIVPQLAIFGNTRASQFGRQIAITRFTAGGIPQNGSFCFRVEPSLTAKQNIG